MPPNNDKIRRRSTSLAEYFHRHREALSHYIRKKMQHHDDAEDVVQETFVRLLDREQQRKGDQLDSMVAPEAYLYRTASNLMVDRLRQQQSRVDEGHREVFEDTVEGSDEPQRNVEASERLQHLRRAVDDLPPKCRQVFILHKFHQLSYREVAAHLDISTSMVEKHMMKALIRLDRAGEETP